MIVFVLKIQRSLEQIFFKFSAIPDLVYELSTFSLAGTISCCIYCNAQNSKLNY